MFSVIDYTYEVQSPLVCPIINMRNVAGIVVDRLT